MAELINADDGEFLPKNGIIKNAVFYRDMLAFYDAYTFFLDTDDADLPSYCYSENGLLLDGILLLIKDYSAGFDFETLELSLDYLRLLYYAVAGFSKDGNFPEKEVIESEFELRKQVSSELLKKSASATEKEIALFETEKERFEGLNRDLNSQKLKTKKFKKLFTISLLIGVLLSVLVAVMFIVKFTLPAVILALFAVGIIILSLSFNKKKKSHLSYVRSLSDKLDREKPVFDKKYNALQEQLEKTEKVSGEVYNYVHNYDSETVFSSETDREKILKKIGRNDIVSTDMVNDIKNLASSHDLDIIDMVNSIRSIDSQNLYKLLCDKYVEIEDKDHLFFNKWVRFAFADKFISSALDNHIWQIKSKNGQMEFPFDINLKEVGFEKIAYLKDIKSLMLAVPCGDLLCSKMGIEIVDVDFEKDLTIEEIKRVKRILSSKFYDYSAVNKYNDIFYSEEKKIGKTISLDILDGKNLIPAIFDVKIKLAEAKVGFENSHNEIVGRTLQAIDEKIEKNNKFIDSVESGQFAEMNNLPEDGEGVTIVGKKKVVYRFGKNTMLGRR